MGLFSRKPKLTSEERVRKELEDKQKELNNINAIKKRQKSIELKLKKLKAEAEKDTKPSLGKVSDKELPMVLDGDEGGVVVEKQKWTSRKSKLKFFDKRRLKKKPETSFLIRMIFSNGTSKEFVISTRAEIFTYKKRTYYLQYDESVFNLTQNQYELSYFDDVPTPLRRRIIKTGDKAFWAVTPENLKPLIEMNYVKVLAQNTEIDKYLKSTTMLTIFNMMLGFIILFFSYKSYKVLQIIIESGVLK